MQLGLTASLIRQETGLDAAVFDLDARLGLAGRFSAGVTAPLVYAPDADEPVGTGAIALVARWGPARLGPIFPTLGAGVSVPTKPGDDFQQGEQGYVTGSFDPILDAQATTDPAARLGAFAGLFARPILYAGQNDTHERDTYLVSAGPRVRFLDRFALEAGALWMHQPARDAAPTADWIFANPRLTAQVGRASLSLGVRLPMAQPDAGGEPRTRYAVALGAAFDLQAFGRARASP